MKNLLKLTFILAILIAFNISTFSQQQFGIKVSGGISRIYGSLESPYPSPSTSSTSFSPSAQAGIYYNRTTGKNTSLGAELVFSQVQGEQMVYWDNNKYLVAPYIEGYRSDITYEHISYLSLPVYFGVTYKRLTINGGFQISYVLSSSGSNESSNNYILLTEEGNRITREEDGINRELDNLDIKAFDFGPRAGIVYRLTNRLSMEGMFYYGLNNINQLKSTEEALKIQQMTVGIRYALWNK